MAKRKFSAKQLANQRRFAKMVRSRRKVKSTSRSTPSMARRRRSGRTVTRVVRSFRRGGRARGGLGSLSRIFKTAAGGVGGAEIAGSISRMAVPQAEPFARVGGAWLGGGVTGVIASIAIDTVLGKPSILSGLGIAGGNGGNGGGSI